MTLSDQRVLTQDPNPDTTAPTGMCGEPKVCEDCPSQFLCWMKAKAELEFITARQRPERQIERFDCGDPKDCICCGEDDPRDECPESPRPCGHHCGHIWTHDSCCWCGTEAEAE